MLYPSISIIIPSFNQGPFIERTLQSIIRQKYLGAVEIIVSDGGSTDETIDILKKYNNIITWWSYKDNGYVDAVMKGIKVASGEIIAIQSSDDYYLENSFNEIGKAFIENDKFAFITGGQVIIDMNLNIVHSELESGEIDTHRILFGKQPQQHSTFVKRKFIEKVNGLRTEVDLCADLDLWYRISFYGKGLYISKFIGVYQLQPKQRTQTSRDWFISLVKMIETVEKDPLYTSIYKLKNEEKTNLYKYWEIFWAANVGDIESARESAKASKIVINNYDLRTQNLINYYYLDYIRNRRSKNLIIKVLLKIKRKLFRQKFIALESTPLSTQELNWWKV